MTLKNKQKKKINVTDAVTSRVHHCYENNS